MVLATIGLLFAAAAADGGTNLVLLFSALGGLSGLAALAMVWVNWRANQRKADTDDKSVAIVELEKAVPGLGEIIKEWQAVVHQLQADLAAEKAKNEEMHRQLAQAQLELEECRRRIIELERGTLGP